ncbi:hypothetical protein HPHPH6_1498 [Helicobacter pylori Hp H-6]|uniref:Uncharacterized protein n=1 Tax=Helicobacter pylori Hp H-6 TaxID=992061 RepID=J0N1E3_HELPX|nr:hypothetical protein HPHPH6_1498 [Helicobacter pylori Hp H-6]
MLYQKTKNYLYYARYGVSVENTAISLTNQYKSISNLAAWLVAA